MKGFIKLSLLSGCLVIAFKSNAQQIATTPDTTQGVKVAVPATAKTAVPKPTAKRVVVKKPKPIRTEMSGGLRLNSNGWGLFVDKGWVRSEEKNRDYFYNIRLAQIELDEVRHPKEVKRSNNPSDNSPMAFAYGKINNFYALKLGYGARRLIAGKPEHGTVAIHWVYLGGFSAGLVKPYYLEVQSVKGGQAGPVETIKYSDSNQRKFLGLREDNGTANYIIGSAGFGKGLGEIGFNPGIHLKTGLHFDFAPSKTMKMAVEAGVSGELYAKKVELMALQKAYPYTVSVYASFQFGKRWQ
ncbi:hypothetical protein [Polluticoccus soli]|uniref:hypothetical protein n=1 Tax=Polluticoccus soli TaxID=3034150 RepID=UPI0023E2721E|nr:hypothetical protein [Flavipsychrobacter sp. JY13-12]